MEPGERRHLGHEYFEDLKAKRKPMRQLMSGSKWFKEISGSLAERVLADAKKAGVPDDELKAMEKRMADWFKILVAYRKDFDAVRREPKMSPEFRRSMIGKMRENLVGIRIKMFGE